MVDLARSINCVTAGGCPKSPNSTFLDFLDSAQMSKKSNNPIGLGLSDSDFLLILPTNTTRPQPHQGPSQDDHLLSGKSVVS